MNNLLQVNTPGLLQHFYMLQIQSVHFECKKFA